MDSLKMSTLSFLVVLEPRTQVSVFHPPRPQNCMNLPPDKVQLLSQYDNEKKWELICDQVGAWKAQLPLLLLLGNPVLRMQELAGEGPAYCPGANMYQGGWGPMQDSLFP